MLILSELGIGWAISLISAMKIPNPTHISLKARYST